MKKAILKFTTLLCIASLIVTSCNTSAEKVEAAKENVIDAKQDLVKANEALLADIEAYKLETANKIENNNKSIIEFNSRIETQKNSATVDYKKKIAELEAKNSDMQKKLDNYKANGKENWESFKTEFNHDMEELGQAFKDLTVNNKK